MLQAVARVQVGFFGAVRDSSEVADAKIDACCLLAGSGGCLDFVFVDEVEFPATLRVVVDGTNLLQVLNLYTGACLVLDKDVFLRFGVFLVIRPFRETNAVVLGIVSDAVLFPRHRTARVFFVDAAAL